MQLLGSSQPTVNRREAKTERARTLSSGSFHAGTRASPHRKRSLVQARRNDWSQTTISNTKTQIIFAPPVNVDVAAARHASSGTIVESQTSSAGPAVHFHPATTAVSRFKPQTGAVARRSPFVCPTNSPPSVNRHPLCLCLCHAETLPYSRQHARNLSSYLIACKNKLLHHKSKKTTKCRENYS